MIAGRRYPLVGTVSMDSVAVDLGPDPTAPALLDQPAVLIGVQGGERITAEELARRLGTINYEITCGLTARVARVHHSDVGWRALPAMDDPLELTRAALAGRRAWLVGGAVRDRLFEPQWPRGIGAAMAGEIGAPGGVIPGLTTKGDVGRHSPRAADLDVVLDGEPREAARALARAAGRVRRRSRSPRSMGAGA